MSDMGKVKTDWNFAPIDAIKNLQQTSNYCNMELPANARHPAL